MVGVYAVFAFYTLSGYLMTQIMMESYGFSRIGRFRYAVNRVLRIFPSYLLVLFITWIVVVVVGEDFSRRFNSPIYIPANPVEWLRNLFLVLSFDTPPRLIPPAWALTVELFYYIAIGIGISKSKRFCWLWLSASAVYHGWTVLFDATWEWRYFHIPAASMPFSSGALIYHYKEEIKTLIGRAGKSSRLLFLLTAAFSANWLLSYTFGTLRGIGFYTNYLIQVGVIATLMQLPHTLQRGWLERVDRWLGALSYPVYLIHMTVGLVLIALVGDLGLERRSPPFFFISVIPVLATSWLIVILVDTPIEALRKRIKGSRTLEAGRTDLNPP